MSSKPAARGLADLLAEPVAAPTLTAPLGPVISAPEPVAPDSEVVEPPPVPAERVKFTVVLSGADDATLRRLTAEVVSAAGIRQRRGPGGGAQAEVVRSGIELLASDPELLARLVRVFTERMARKGPALSSNAR